MDLQEQLKRRTQRRRLLAMRRYRSRRFWRTISRRRRAIGISVLAILIVLASLIAYITSTGRVERLAEEYLTRLTGRRVRVGQAKFSPFEGIRLRNLRVWPAGEGELRDADAVFQADDVLMELAPGSVLTGRLKVNRIVVVRPTIRQVEGPTGEASYARQNRGGEKLPALPPIELREGRFQAISKLPGQPPITTLDVPLSAELRPDADVPQLYHITGRWAGREQIELIPVSGNVWMDPFRVETNIVVVKSLQQLPHQIEQILARYQIDTAHVKARGGFDARTGQIVVQFDCHGTAMTLSLADLVGMGGANASKPAPSGVAAGGKPASPAEIPLKLTGVYGTILVRAAAKVEPGQQSPPGQILFGEADEQALASHTGLVRGMMNCWRIFAGPVQPLRGRLNNQPFELSGRYDGFSPDASFQATMRMGGIVIPQDTSLIDSFPRWVGNLYKDFQPTGAIDLDLDVHRPKPGGAVEVRGQARLVDCAVTYYKYPWPIDHVNGAVRFADQKADMDLTGRHGQTVVHLGGWSGWIRPWPMDMTVTGRNVPISREVLDAVATDRPGEVRTLRSLQLDGGQVDFQCHTWRSDSPDDSAHATVSFSRIDGVNLTPPQFDYPLCVRGGQAESSDQGIKFTDLKVMPRHLLRPVGAGGATSQPQIDSLAEATVNGFVGRAREGDPAFRLDLAAISLPLDETLWRALPGGMRDAVLRYHIDARAALFGTVSRRPGEPIDFDLRGRLDPHHGFIKADDFPYALEAMDGNVRVTPRMIELENVTGRHNGVRILASGRIGIADTQPTDIVLRNGHDDRLPLDDELKAALPPNARKVWDKLSPTGWVAVDVHLRQPAASQPDAEKSAGATTRPVAELAARPPLTTEITVTALGNGLTYDAFPYRMENVRGQVVIRPDRVDIVDMTDTAGDRVINLSGTIWPDRDNGDLPVAKAQPSADLKIVANNLAFNEPLRQAVPKEIRRMWNDLLPTGQFDLRLDHLRYTTVGGLSFWDYDGRLDIRDGHVTFGITLDRVNGQLVGSGRIVPGAGVVLRGSFEKVDAVVADRPVTSLSGTFLLNKGLLRLDKLAAQMYGGRVEGFGEVNVSDPDLPYSLALSGQDIDLDKLVNQTSAPADRWNLAGRLDGQVNLKGKASTSSRSGDGQILLTAARVYQVPTILPMFANGLDKPANPNQSAEIIFRLDGDRLLFEHLSLRDPQQAFEGAGAVDLASRKVDLTFVAGPPARKPAPGPGKVLTEIFSGAGDDLMSYHLSGPLDKPVIEATSLHTLRDALEKVAEARKQYLEAQEKAAAAHRSSPPSPTPAPPAP